MVSYIREKASMWKKILPYSVWASAVGSLVNAVASKIIAGEFHITYLTGLASLTDFDQMSSIFPVWMSMKLSRQRS